MARKKGAVNIVSSKTAKDVLLSVIIDRINSNSEIRSNHEAHKMKRHPQIKIFAIISILLGFYFFASPYQTCLRDNIENDNKMWVHENCKRGAVW